jgi:O-antigen biosynthesis protein
VSLDTFAQQWAVEHAGETMAVQRLIGFCLLVRKVVVERIGGLDERFGAGNFEDDDFSVRATLAGYEGQIAKDVFIHHTGGQTFRGANIDYTESLLRNWSLFKAKWGIPPETPLEEGYSVPAQVLAPTQKVPLPELMATHHCEWSGRWWYEERKDTEILLRGTGRKGLRIC